MKSRCLWVRDNLVECRSCSVEDTRTLGAILARSVFAGMMVFLEGDLGAGKTEFVRGFAGGLEASGVRSPSFTLVNEYQGRISLAHADLYRLSDESSDELGLTDYAERGWIVMIEWAEKWKTRPDEESICIRISVPGDGPDGDAVMEDDFFIRKITLTSKGEKAGEALCRFVGLAGGKEADHE